MSIDTHNLMHQIVSRKHYLFWVRVVKSKLALEAAMFVSKTAMVVSGFSRRIDWIDPIDVMVPYTRTPATRYFSKSR